MSMNSIARKECKSCEDKDMKPLAPEAVKKYMAEVPDWKISPDGKMISKERIFKDFVHALSFVETVADIAEMEGHHPDIHIFYNKVRLELSTHSIGGLSENDFILAAKIDSLWLS